MDTNPTISAEPNPPHFIVNSTFQVRSMAGPTVVVHDMYDRTVISEVDLEQADLLLEQLQTAVANQTMASRDRAGPALPL